MTTEESQIDFRDLLGTFWKQRFMIIAISLVSSISAVIYALSLPNIFTATAVVAPREDDSGAAGLASLASRYGALASFAGVDLGRGSSNTKASLAIESLKTFNFFRLYLYESMVLDLIAANSWDMSQNELLYDPDIYDQEKGVWVRDSSPPLPTEQEAFRVFGEVFSVMEDSKTGFIAISVEHLSPYVAKAWVDLIVGSINKHIKVRDELEATKAVEFLIEQRSKTAVVSLNEIFAQLIEEQTKNIMLANVSAEYVLQTIEPAFVPELKSKPSRPMICLIGSFLGFFFAITIALWRYFFQSETS